MRPFDPRLVRHVPAVRRDVALLGLLAVGVAIAIVVAAWMLATTLAALPRVSAQPLAGFVAALAARAGLTGLMGVVAARIAATVKATLRSDLLRATAQRGPAWLAGQRAGEIATLTGRGLDALDSYFTGYLPQLVLGATVPIAVLVTLTAADLASAVIVLVTLPLIPVFGILIGWQTRAATEKQWRRLQMLGGHFLDMVTGLGTLKAFGRARAQVSAVRDMADRHRVATMRTLRVAFLSALVLELVGTIAVALVAVPIGLRLLSGGMTLATALLVLLLTPEAFAPLRAAGTRFHASMEGLTALDQAFTLLTPASPACGTAAVAPWRTIVFEGVTVEYDRVTALSNVDLTITAGERIALVGPSGGGKSTLMHVLLGFTTPTRGRVLVDGRDLSTLDIEAWRRQLAWVPQRAHLFAGTLASNIALGEPGADEPALARAALAAALPHDLRTELGERGFGMSTGERQRVALARAFLRDAPLLLLDEPTARLDSANEALVIDATRRLAEAWQVPAHLRQTAQNQAGVIQNQDDARDGLLAGARTVILVAHRPALLDIATRVVHVSDGVVSEVDARSVEEAGAR